MTSKSASQIRVLFLSIAFVLASAFWMIGLSNPPNSRPHVTDEAELFSGQTKETLEEILSGFRQETTHEIFVATFPTLGDETPESFGSRLADEWKIGYKDMANGAILLIFKKEHQARLEVGIGLDRRLPFPFRKELINQKLAPYFRNHRYDEGVMEAARQIISKIDPLYPLPRRGRAKPITPWKKMALIFAFVFLITLVWDIISYWVYLGEMRHHPENVYQKRIGRYSFLEWWLIYGLLTTAFEYIYYHLFIFWFNPAWSITSGGGRRIFLKGKTGRGHFRGNGIAGRW